MATPPTTQPAPQGRIVRMDVAIALSFSSYMVLSVSFFLKLVRAVAISQSSKEEKEELGWPSPHLLKNIFILKLGRKIMRKNSENGCGHYSFFFFLNASLCFFFP